MTKILSLIIALVFSSSIYANTQSQLSSMKNRLQKYSDKLNTPAEFYFYSKANEWLRTAHSQYHENDRTNYISESLEQAERFILAFEKQSIATLDSETPQLNNSPRIRIDLWNQIREFKSHPSFKCTAHDIAHAEIQLVRAEHQDHQTGWRGARVFIEMSEDAIHRAMKKLNLCQ